MLLTRVSVRACEVLGRLSDAGERPHRRAQLALKLAFLLFFFVYLLLQKFCKGIRAHRPERAALVVDEPLEHLFVRVLSPLLRACPECVLLFFVEKRNGVGALLKGFMLAAGWSANRTLLVHYLY